MRERGGGSAAGVGDPAGGRSGAASDAIMRETSELPRGAGMPGWDHILKTPGRTQGGVPVGHPRRAGKIVRGASIRLERSRGLGTLLLLSLVSGCSGTDAPSAASVAGGGDAVLVENPLQGDGALWTVDPAPLWTLGSAQGDSTRIFTRITGLLPVGAGGFAVLDATPRTLRIHDREGGLLEVLGGEGMGRLELPATLLPGEGDTLVVHDVGLRQRLWFVPGEGYLRSEALEGGGRSVLGWLPGGERVVRVEEPLPQLLSPGMLERGVTVRIEGPDTPDVEVGRFPGIPLLVHSSGREGRTPDVSPLPFRSGPVVGVWNGRVVVSPGMGELTEYGVAGDPLRIIRTGVPPRRIPEQMLADIIQARTAAIPDPELRGRVQADLRAAGIPGEAPVFADLRVDPAGNLWLLAYRLPGDPVVQDWWVVDPEGRTLGRVRMPPRVSLRVAGLDDILGTTADDDGVIRIVRHALLK